MTLILAGLGTLAVMELETPQRAIMPVNAPPAQATVGPRDTLTTADRLKIPHMLQAPPQPISSSEVVPLPDQTAVVTQETSKIIKQKPSAPGRISAVVLPRPRVEHGKATAKLNRVKPVTEVKPCPSGVFDGVFRALNLSTRCQT
ncbi:hypothetical protein [Bradyrhizobium sp. CCBAU 53340]|uniref:hypothetical protein n=1 Tax=Bradyrhizobium sp. CCBAU 53340 TaxID=1325112 RepID=UPI001FEE2DB6|nr:hypothetical protein [Bradyrhizobium sp. CCBAU 53340]